MALYSKAMSDRGDIKPAECEALGEALAADDSRLGIVAAYLHGSRARGEALADSDIDIAVFTDGSAARAGDTTRLEFELCERLERTSGLKRLDVRILDRAPLMARGKVLTEGRLLYSGDESARVRLERDTRIRYLDYLPKMRWLNRALLASMAEKGLGDGGSR